MDKGSTRRTALMSIRPEYVEAIISGAKTVEFRKQRLAPDVETVVIYATSPIKAVVGEFQITSQVSKSPTGLWREFKLVSGIDRRRFFEYFRGRSSGVGIVIGNVTAYAPQKRLEDVAPGSRPPQSFRYLEDSAA